MAGVPQAQVFLACQKVTWDGAVPTLAAVILGISLPPLAAHQVYNWEVSVFWVTRRNGDLADHMVSLRFLDPRGVRLAHWPAKPMPPTDLWAQDADLRIGFVPIEGRYRFVLDLDDRPFATAPIEVFLGAATDR